MPTRITSANVASVSGHWGRAVRAQLRRTGGTITGLARDLKVSRQHLTRTVDGDKATITVGTYLAVCERLGLDPDRYTSVHESTPPWDSEQ